MHAYKVYGGPCHYDIQLSFYIKLGKTYIKKIVGNVNTPKGRARYRSELKGQIKRLSEGFDKFFNPDKKKGVWKEYKFDPCCSFHIDISIQIPPPNAAALPEDTGIIEVEMLSMKDHPNAKIGGKKVVVSHDSGRHVFAHELGHILGLPDDYITKDIPELNVVGNGMTKAQENAHKGHLMGKAKKGLVRNRRIIQQHEIDAIAVATGMTCKKSTCCPDEVGQAPSSFPETEEEYYAFIKDGEKELPVIEERKYFEPHAAILDYSLAEELLGPTLYKELTPSSRFCVWRF